MIQGKMTLKFYMKINNIRSSLSKKLKKTEKHKIIILFFPITTGPISPSHILESRTEGEPGVRRKEVIEDVLIPFV